jgi:hypothetical protein
MSKRNKTVRECIGLVLGDDSYSDFFDGCDTAQGVCSVCVYSHSVCSV